MLGNVLPIIADLTKIFVNTIKWVSTKERLDFAIERTWTLQGRPHDDICVNYWVIIALIHVCFSHNMWVLSVASYRQFLFVFLQHIPDSIGSTNMIIKSNCMLSQWRMIGNIYLDYHDNHWVWLWFNIFVSTGRNNQLTYVKHDSVEGAHIWRNIGLCEHISDAVLFSASTYLTHYWSLRTHIWRTIGLCEHISDAILISARRYCFEGNI